VSTSLERSGRLLKLLGDLLELGILVMLVAGSNDPTSVGYRISDNCWRLAPIVDNDLQCAVTVRRTVIRIPSGVMRHT